MKQSIYVFLTSLFLTTGVCGCGGTQESVVVPENPAPLPTAGERSATEFEKPLEPPKNSPFKLN